MNIYEIDAELYNLVDENGEILDYDRFMALQMARETKIENTACWVVNLNAEIAALKAEEDKLKTRRQSAEKQVAKLKQYIGYALNGEKFKSPRVSVSYRSSKAVVVDDEFVSWAEKNNPDLLSFKAPEPNKTNIKALLEAGQEVEHAGIQQNTSVIIK